MPKAHPQIWRVQVTVLLPAVEAVEAVMERFTDAVSWFLEDPAADETDENTLWRLEGFAKAAPDRAQLETGLALAAAALGMAAPALTIEQVPDTDWVLANLRDFPPIRAGRFFVHGSHFDGVPPAGSVPLLVDAGAAFGSGEHATTAGCLTALDRLLKRHRFRHALDLGCGSGILGIGLAKRRPGVVHAADIDPVSVRVAAANAKRNRVGRRVKTLVSAGYGSRGVLRGRPYDLILANILARPLAAMAADLKRHLAPGGIAVLSGLLNRQEAFVLAPHRAQGLSLAWRIRRDGWSTLVLKSSPSSRV